MAVTADEEGRNEESIGNVKQSLRVLGAAEGLILQAWGTQVGALYLILPTMGSPKRPVKREM